METKRLEGSWTLIRELDSSSRPMAVPGDIMSALLAAGEISDPYVGMNELDLQWVGREDWRIERELELSAADLEGEGICLEALVLDTIAEVRINGSLLGTSRNMFRRFRADAKKLLHVGKNLISITIRSPEKAAAEAAALLPYPIPASEYPVFSPHRNLIRKAQFMAGWDWGPCLMTGGVYDRIGLLCHDGPRIEYATTRMRRVGTGEGRTWKVSVEVELEAAVGSSVTLEATLGGARAESQVEAAQGRSSHRLDLEVRGVEDWNPAGYGKQPLYELVVSAIPAASGKDQQSSMHRGACLRKRLGFRELAVLAKEDEWGKSLTFVVNGRRVFAKGANWIPADSLPSRWTTGRLEDLLGSAVAANMNCLRVWGGGRYESDAFYELCDELGILIWQDCMFSCALYPSDPAFLAEVEAEIRDQVRRLMDHPCLALWCGNNEALGAITWYEASKKSPARYIADYDRLTEGCIGRVVKEIDPDRQWWPSSPSAGPNDFGDNWHEDGRGDMHFWSVWHEGKPFSAYLDVRPRFCSEFGYQSFPSERAVASFASEADRNVASPVFEHHQRHPRGNAIIIENMLRYFRMPSGFSQALYLSQVQQALAIRTAVEYWRSLQPRCMGTLYWQLNDVWPVSSWSSLDYDGGWKLLHYEARRFYEPLHLALVVKDGCVEAHAMNDGLQALPADLDLALRRFDAGADGEKGSARRYSAKGTIPAGGSVLLWKASIADLGCKPEEHFLDASLATGDGEKRRARAFLTEPKRCALPDARLMATVEGQGDKLQVRLRAEAPTFLVALTLDPKSGFRGRFEDSGFDLGAGEEIQVRYLPSKADVAQDLCAGKLAEALRIMDLAGSSR